MGDSVEKKNYNNLSLVHTSIELESRSPGKKIVHEHFLTSHLLALRNDTIPPYLYT